RAYQDEPPRSAAVRAGPAGGRPSADLDDLDGELGAGGRGERHDVADRGTEQRLPERRRRADDVEVVVALLDGPDEVALDLVVALVADADHRAVRDDVAPLGLHDLGVLEHLPRSEEHTSELQSRA